ncbi:MAG: DUF4433 domain-containing protein [Mesorhizobium sp.]|uniref:hypothetical protein n=1 Tax=Mesorhizobium sp. TaxID=1871066 RepID=UPI00122878E8|nr:hypothetical protein [Mesorhizobium sp.]TIR25966.1 MAG: DUF4433 domain-containing protein [Mesorhizobium sp.]
MAKAREEWGDAQLVAAIHEHLGGALYHFSDRANEASIDKHGLLLKAEAAARGIRPEMPGGNSLTNFFDARDGLVDYVFISFFKTVLMPKDRGVDRLRRPMMLAISPEILLLKGVEVRIGRGAGARRFKTMRAFHEMDWDVWFRPELREDTMGGKARWSRFLDYEVLVPKCVPRHYILGIAE